MVTGDRVPGPLRMFDTATRRKVNLRSRTPKSWVFLGSTLNVGRCDAALHSFKTALGELAEDEDFVDCIGWQERVQHWRVKLSVIVCSPCPQSEGGGDQIRSVWCRHWSSRDG